VTRRACPHCGAVDCQRHGSGAWRQKPAGNRGGYGAAYQHARKILLRRAGCRPGTGIGGACAICGKPGVPSDPLQADHIVSVDDGGGDELSNLRAIHKSEHARRTAHQSHAKRRKNAQELPDSSGASQLNHVSARKEN
jgi:5-methylcytosine-specific restriction endonuclease McrA